MTKLTIKPFILNGYLSIALLLRSCHSCRYFNPPPPPPPSIIINKLEGGVPAIHLKAGLHRPSSEMSFDGGPTMCTGWVVRPQGNDKLACSIWQLNAVSTGLFDATQIAFHWLADSGPLYSLLGDFAPVIDTSRPLSANIVSKTFLNVKSLSYCKTMQPPS